MDKDSKISVYVPAIFEFGGVIIGAFESHSTIIFFIPLMIRLHPQIYG